MRLVGEVWRLTPQRCGCFDFLQPGIDEAVLEVSRQCPAGYALLGEDAVRDMKDNYLERLKALYEQPLLYCIHEIVKNYDALEYLSTSGNNIDALNQSGRDLRDKVMSDGGKALRERFFLAPGYEKAIRENFISSQVEFLQQLLEKKMQIEKQLLGGCNFSRILRLSCGGADMHQENIMSCGVYPSCLDIETILSPRHTAESRKHTPFPPYFDYIQSVSGSGVMPVRLHKGGMMSPLYAENESMKCLPRYQEKIPDPYPLTAQPMTAEEATEELKEILGCIQKEIIHNTDGAQSFSSDIVTTQNLSTSGVLTSWADVGTFCAGILLNPILHPLQEEASKMALICLDGLGRFVSHCSSQNLPVTISSHGLATGLGSILLCLDRMKRAGLPGADTVFSSWLDVAAGHANDTIELFDTLKETCSLWNVKEGNAGLLLAFSEFRDPAEKNLIAAYGQHTLEGFPLSRYDGLEGAAGIGAALAYAFCATKDPHFSNAADEAFRQVLSAYSDHLRDWPKPKAFMPWAASRSDFAAGIGAAASLALRWYDSQPARTVQKLALDALNREELLARLDSLNNGNALRVLCYLLSVSSGSEHLNTAGRILKAMRERKKEHGSYTISQPYVRSYFDVSAALGTIGIGDVILLYLTMMYQ